jgi:hypothetical protein
MLAVLGLLLMLGAMQVLQMQEPQAPQLQRATPASALCGLFQSVRMGREMFQGAPRKTYTMVLLMAVPSDAPDPYFPYIKACAVPLQQPKPDSTVP